MSLTSTCNFHTQTVSQTGSLAPGIVGKFDLYADPPTNEDDIYKDLSNRTRVIGRDEIKCVMTFCTHAFINESVSIESDLQVSQ